MNSRRGATEQEKLFAFGPFAGKQDCWYEHVPVCQDDPHCFRGTCGLSHPDRDAKGVRWEWVYPNELFEHRPKETTPAPAERASIEARQYWDQVEKDTRAFDPWGWNNATIRQNLSYTDHLATPLQSTQVLPEVQTPTSASRLTQSEESLTLTQKPPRKRASPKKKSSDAEDAKFTESKLEFVPTITPTPTTISTISTPEPTSTTTTLVTMDLEKVEVPAQADPDSFATKAHDIHAPSTLETSYETKDTGRLMFLEMSDEESSASEGLSFTLRGGRADCRPTRRSMPENQPVIDPTKEVPKGYLGKLVLFISAIFAFFAAFGDAILEGTGACFFRLGDAFSSKQRGQSKRKTRERRSTWKKRSS